MERINAKILKNKKVAGTFYKMRIESPYLARNIKPGQFIEVRCSDGSDPLLRRPLGVHRILKNGVEILYEIVGKGTELLSQKKTGEHLDAIGPLGNGFDMPYALNPIPCTLLIAGGIGVAPLVALAERLIYRKKRNIYVIIGAKTKFHLLCEKDFKDLGCKVSVVTEDGSKGSKGLATGLLKNLLKTHNSKLSTIYACGPNAMLKEVAKLARDKRIPCQVSLEERMACGVGVCLGCPVKVRKNLIDSEYKMVCKDGPIFDAEDIIW